MTQKTLKNHVPGNPTFVPKPETSGPSEQNFIGPIYKLLFCSGTAALYYVLEVHLAAFIPCVGVDALPRVIRLSHHALP